MTQFDAAYLDSLPKIPMAPQASGIASNPLVSGFMSGAGELGASLAGFGGAVGRATGITPLAEGGEDWARRLGAAAQAARG